MKAFPSQVSWTPLAKNRADIASTSIFFFQDMKFLPPSYAVEIEREKSACSAVTELQICLDKNIAILVIKAYFVCIFPLKRGRHVAWEGGKKRPLNDYST